MTVFIVPILLADAYDTGTIEGPLMYNRVVQHLHIRTAGHLERPTAEIEKKEKHARSNSDARKIPSPWAR